MKEQFRIGDTIRCTTPGTIIEGLPFKVVGYSLHGLVLCRRIEKDGTVRGGRAERFNPTHFERDRIAVEGDSNGDQAGR